MPRIELRSETDFGEWATHAGQLLAAGIPAASVVWKVGGDQDLFCGEHRESGGEGLSVPEEFARLARPVLQHRDPERFSLLYALLVRWQFEPAILRRVTDREVAWALRMAKAVKRDIHKMHAFVRFRQVAAAEPEQFVAWFEPDNYIEEAAAPFFARRFSSMRWSILTPRRSVHWTGSELLFESGRKRSDAPEGDMLDDLWRTYYAHIFNPARLKPQAMRSEMPKKYWHNLPEARLIRPLMAEAEARSASMVAAAPTEPAPHSVAADRQARLRAIVPPPPDSLQACARCPIGATATQAVAGDGPTNARIMLIGEQPGDEEDLTGRPFVGPAGRMLDRALAAAGLNRRELFLTNAVKHFKFEPRGKRRIHRRPGTDEIEHCAWWLRQEIEAVDPEVIVALGGTAAYSILGRPVKIGEARGKWLALSERTQMIITVHPAYVLRLPHSEQGRGFTLLVEDLRQVSNLQRGRIARSAA